MRQIIEFALHILPSAIFCVRAILIMHYTSCVNTQRGKLSCGEYSVNCLSFSDFDLRVRPVNRSKIIAKLPHPTAAIAPTTNNFVSSIAKRFSQNRPSEPSLVSVPFDLTCSQFTPPVGRYRFLDYARQNWACDTIQISSDSPVWAKFKTLALEPNLSWGLHPWVSSGQSLVSHYHGLLGCAIQLGHLALLNLLFSPEVQNTSARKIRFLHYCNYPLNAIESIGVPRGVQARLSGYCQCSDTIFPD